MRERTKAILVNAGVTAALILELYRGAPLVSILIVAVVFYPLANLLMYRKRLSRKPQERG